MNRDESVSQAELVTNQAADVRSQSKVLRAEAMKMAGRIADTEEMLAETLKRLASQHPSHEERLRAMSEAAASHAAQERQRANGHARPSPAEDDQRSSTPPTPVSAG